jgi:tripeptidyl-peptidase-1
MSRCRYGMHLSQEQVAEIVAPHPDTLKLVKAWLEHYGVPSSSLSITHNGNWLKVTSVPVSQANELLGASYQLYRHTETNDTILRTITYALPAALQAHVKTVAPTTYFGSPRTLSKPLRMRPGRTAAAPPGEMLSSREDDDVSDSDDSYDSDYDDADNYITPKYLRWLYNSVVYVPKATSQNVLGIAGYHGEYPNPVDLHLFLNEYRTPASDATYNVVPISGGEYKPITPGADASLNIQYAQAIAYPTPHIFYSIGGQPPFTPDSSTPIAPDSHTPINTNEPFLDWLEYLFRQQNIPPTISSSYSESEQTVPLDYATSVCDLFAELGLRGISILTSSGSVGVGAGACLVNDGSGKVQFLPQFPSSCTYGTQGAAAGAKVAHHTFTQVPGSLASAALRTTPRSRRASPVAVSRTTLRFHPIRNP